MVDMCWNLIVVNCLFICIFTEIVFSILSEMSFQYGFTLLLHFLLRHSYYMIHDLVNYGVIISRTDSGNSLSDCRMQLLVLYSAFTCNTTCSCAILRCSLLFIHPSSPFLFIMSEYHIDYCVSVRNARKIQYHIVRVVILQITDCYIVWIVFIGFLCSLIS